MSISSVIGGFVAQNPTIFHLCIIIASFIVLVKAADLAVTGITNYARELGVSDYLIGLLVVAIASSMPELVSAFTGTMAGDSGIILGTIMGSNIAGLTLVLGCLGLIGRRTKIDVKLLEDTKLDIFILASLPFILMIDDQLSRIDGIVLIFAFIAYTILLWRKEGQVGTIKKDVKLKTIYQDAAIFVGCIAALLLSGRWLVFSSIKLAQDLDIPSFTIALVIIGIGTTAPDMMVAIKSMLRGHHGIGFGNALGSLMIKSLLFLGVLALIKPIKFPFVQIIPAMIVVLLSVGMTLLFVRNKEIDWKKGLTMLFIYLGFIIFQLTVGG